LNLWGSEQLFTASSCNQFTITAVIKVSTLRPNRPHITLVKTPFNDFSNNRLVETCNHHIITNLEHTQISFLYSCLSFSTSYIDIIPTLSLMSIKIFPYIFVSFLRANIVPIALNPYPITTYVKFWPSCSP